MRVIFIFSILMFGFNLELTAQCTSSANSALNVNNVEAGVLNNGFMWWDGVSDNTFKFPKGSHYSPLFSKSMVISALDGYNLKMASAVMFNSGIDFFLDL